MELNTIQKNGKPSQPQPIGDPIQNLIGNFGKYQLLLCLFVFLSKFPIAFHQMAIIFLAPKASYVCPDTNAQTCPCADPEYDKSLFDNTIVMEWGLICDRKWMASLTQTLFQLGTLIGSILFGMFSDKFGRKIPMLVAVFFQVLIGVTAAFIRNYWLFTFLRFVIGVTVGGTMVISFVIVMEFVGTKYRDVVSACYQIPFVMGHMLLPGFAYFFRNYRDFQLAISLPTIVLLSYICLLPETPRWLIAAKRTDDAVKILEKVAGVNKLPKENIRPQVEAYIASLESHRMEKGSVLDLFRTPNLRKNTIVMAFNWLTCSYCFYGVSQYVGQLDGNVFMNVAASAGVVLIGNIAAIPMLRVVGRKVIVVSSNFLCCACLITLAMVPEGTFSVALACIGTVSSFVVFVVTYLHCTELFPTVVRNAAMGFSSMSARVGSMIAPFVIDLRNTALWLPPVLFAVLPFFAGILVLKLLPETRGCELTTTIEEGEQFGRKNTTEQPVKKDFR